MVTPLAALVDRVEPILSAMNELDVSIRPAPGKWSKKEILGHLIDSAANNHQRIIRLQLTVALELPGYAQDDWVRLNGYQRSPWAGLVALWSAYNRHLAAVIEQIDEATLGHVWQGPEGDATLEYLAEDYVVHQQHHLRQIGLDV